jgi:hypothetical protein
VLALRERASLQVLAFEFQEVESVIDNLPISRE